MSLTIQPVKRFQYLDSARGLAALSVITWHFFTSFVDFGNGSFVMKSPFHFFWYGEADVLFFFIHSGFILSYSYLGRQKTFTASTYIRFLIERIFRIYPLFLFILIASFFLRHTLYPVSGGSYVTEHLRTFWQNDCDWELLIKQSILIVPIPAEANLRLIPQDWTLTVEIIVGALIPLMGLLLKKSKWIYWITVIALIKILHFNTYIFEFAAGVFLFYHWPDITSAWSRLPKMIKAITLIFAVAFYSCFLRFSSLFVPGNIVFTPGIDRLIVTIGCCIFFCVIISSLTIQKILSHTVLVKVGRVCYSIYLVHMLLLIAFGDQLLRILHNMVSMSQMGYLTIAFAIYMISTVGISFFTFALIEKPFNKYGKLVGKKCELYFNNKFGAFFQKKMPI